MFRRIILITLTAIIFIFVSSCGSSEKKTNSQVTNNSIGITTVTTVQEEADKDIRSYIPDSSIRPYAVMIDNEGSRPLPQGGLSKAQVIYEIIVEGGVTRLMPVFWDADPEMIGPVRSARNYFLDFAMEHNAIFVHCGGSPMAYKDIKTLKIEDLDGVTGKGGDIFWDITKQKGNWQDTYTSMKKIIGAATGKMKYNSKTEKENMVFQYNTSDTDLNSTHEAKNISIQYSSGYKCGYTYDESLKIYLRFRKDVPQMERTSNKQLTAKNIIIQNVRNGDIEGDDKGRQVLGDIGSGLGWFITDGKAIKINWSKASREAKTKYLDEAGKSIVLNPGQTWVQIVPLNGKVDIK